MDYIYTITGISLFVLLCLMVIIGSIRLSVVLVKKIRGIDFFWLLYMSCSYRNRKSKHDMLKDLIDTCNAHAGYFHNQEHQKNTANSILNYLHKYCKDNLKDNK